jgi:predicted ester cyclase
MPPAPQRRGIALTNRRVEFKGMTFWRIARGRIAKRWAEIDYVALEAAMRG